MSLIDLQKDIKNKSLKNIYIFSGEEIGVMNSYIERMAVFNELTVKRYDFFSEIEQQLKSKNLFGKKTLYYIYNDNELLKDDKKIQSIIDNKLFINGVLVLRYDKIDNRKKLFQAKKDEIIIFGKIHSDVLYAYMDGHFSLRTRAEQKLLLEYCNYDYTRIFVNEIDKIKRVAKIFDKQFDMDEALKYFIKNNMIYKQPQDVIFELVEAIMLNEKDNVYRLLKESLDSGEHVLTIIKVLINNLFNLLQYKGIKTDDIQKRTGLLYIQIEKCRLYSSYWNIHLILKCISVIREMEIKIKLGRVDINQALLYILSWCL